MTFSIVGGVMLLAGLVAAVYRPSWLAWVLAASAAFPATAAITAGGNSVPPFFLLALVAVPLILTAPKPEHPTPPALKALVAFAAVTVVVTAFAPWWFAGQPILLPRGGIDAQVVTQTPLGYTSSMVAQVGYLLLGLLVVVFIARRTPHAHRLPEAAFMAGIGLSVLRWVVERAGVAWPEQLFHNYANVTFNRYETRFYGIFPEPSYLAVFGVASAVYYAARLGRTSGRERVLPGVMLAASLFVLVLSGSGTAALAAVLLGGAVYVAYFAPFVMGRKRIPPVAFLLLGAPVVGLVVALPLISRLVDTISTKADSQSAGNRFGADQFSLELVLHTWGMGVGLGANRPSSFLTMLLSCTGVVGTVVFGYAVVRLLLPALRRPELHAAAAGLVGLLVAKGIGEPSMSAPLLWVLFGTLLAGARSPGTPPVRGSRRKGRPVADRPVEPVPAFVPAVLPSAEPAVGKHRLPV